MYSDDYSVEDLAKILGEDDPVAQKGLDIVKICPGKTSQIRREFLLRLKWKGFRLGKLPAFTISVNGYKPDTLVIGRALLGDQLGPEVGPSLRELRTPVVIGGITGTGKSTIVMILARAIQRHNENLG